MILFFLVVVIILEHTQKNRMGSICLQFSSVFRVMDSFVFSQELIKVAYEKYQLRGALFGKQ